MNYPVRAVNSGVKVQFFDRVIMTLTLNWYDFHQYFCFLPHPCRTTEYTFIFTKTLYFEKRVNQEPQQGA